MKLHLIKYEIRNIIGNFYVALFGLILPIFLGAVIPFGVLRQIPDPFKETVLNSIVLSMAIIIPMCVGFIGYGASYAQELEKKIPLRFKLFGISNRDFLMSKFIGQFAVVTLSLIIYFLAMYFIHGVHPVNLKGSLIYFAFLYIFTLAFIMMAHAIADMIGRFGPTYAVVMAIYFFFMFISGSMGLRYEDFPDFLKKISDVFPLAFFGNESINIWQDKLTQYGPLIQSTLTLLVIASLLLLVASYKRRKI